MKKILLIGGGGHCRSCIDVIEASGKYQIVGVIDSNSNKLGLLLNYPLIGADNDLPRLLIDTPNAIVTVGQIKSPETRIRLFTILKSLGAEIPSIISPFAYFSPHAKIGHGTIVMHGALVNYGAKISDNCIINTQALIEHDSEISAHCHISTGVKVNGGVQIGTGCFIGSGAILKEGIKVGENTIIGAGQIVLNDIPANVVIKGSYD